MPMSGFLSAQSVWQFTTASGDKVAASWSGISANGAFADPALSGMTVGDLVAMESQRTVNGATTAVQIDLAGSGRLLVRDPEIVDEQILFQSESGLAAIPLESAKAIRWDISPGVDRLLVDPPADQDLVVVRVGEKTSRLPGIIEGIEAGKLTLNFKGQSRKIDLSKVVVAMFADLQLQPPGGTLATVRMIDGSMLVGAIASADERSLTMKLHGNSDVSIPETSLASIAFQSDRVRYLSDLEPMSAEVATQFTIQRSWQRDRSVTGEPLTLNGPENTSQAFKKGIGTQSWSRIVFANDKSFDRFQAVAGIDIDTNGRGDCLMTVRGDGIVLWSARVRGGEPGIEIDVSVEDIDAIELLVEPGEQFDLADHADWAEARFLKTD